jgi:uroporphyrinogen-III decarboxylase
VHPVEVVLQGDAQAVESALEQCFKQARGRYIVGAGCEIPRGTPKENMMAMSRFARRHTNP